MEDEDIEEMRALRGRFFFVLISSTYGFFLRRKDRNRAIKIPYDAQGQNLIVYLLLCARQLHQNTAKHNRIFDLLALTVIERPIQSPVLQGNPLKICLRPLVVIQQK